ncbi:hypothetical protein V8V88_36825, partial [Paenibacillus phytohabitans]
ENEERVKPKKPKALSAIPDFDTTVPADLLRSMNRGLLQWPQSLTVYPKLEPILKRRETALHEENKVD